MGLYSTTLKAKLEQISKNVPNMEKKNILYQNHICQVKEPQTRIYNQLL